MSTTRRPRWLFALGLLLVAAGLEPGSPAGAADIAPSRTVARCLCLVRFCPKPSPCLPRPFLCACCPTYDRKEPPAACHPPVCRQPATYCAKPLPCPPRPVGCCPVCDSAQVIPCACLQADTP